MVPSRQIASGILSSIRNGRVGISVAAIMLVSGPASAQSGGLLGGLFAILGGSPAPPALSRAPPADAGPGLATPGLSITITPNQTPAGSGVVVAYCVRLCDGRYFPLPLSVGSSQATPIKRCNALCPASKTGIYLGADINASFAANGSPYSSLDTAFTYRTALVADCTCNGKNIFGTAPVDIAADPTLRSGDIVARQGGLQVFTGPIRDAHRANDFSPIEKYTKLSASLRAKFKW